MFVGAHVDRYGHRVAGTTSFNHMAHFQLIH